jgi:hypothetical protein
MSIVLKGVARSVLALLERYGCIKGNEAEGLRWLIEDTTITDAELKGLLLELKDRLIGCDAVPMPLALSAARQISEVVGSE